MSNNDNFVRLIKMVYYHLIPVKHANNYGLDLRAHFWILRVMFQT